jgi:hypothetical protein
MRYKSGSAFVINSELEPGMQRTPAGILDGSDAGRPTDQAPLALTTQYGNQRRNCKSLPRSRRSLQEH